MSQTRGFVTIATGNRWYYILARNLLRSYRTSTQAPLPFAIITDRGNNLTELFDRVIILDHPCNSYLDKLGLAEYLPYDETIFIDADCLAYADLNPLFNIFHGASEVSCFGMTEPLREQNAGWFSLQTFPEEAQDGKTLLTRAAATAALPYSVGMHGGLMYMRKTERTARVFSDALGFAENYTHYNFKLFEKPADEPVLALSMALHHCQPVPYERFDLCCFWTCKAPKLDMYHQKARRRNGCSISLLHWGTRHTQTPLYKKQIDQLNMRIQGASIATVFRTNCINNFWILRYRLKRKWRKLTKR